MIADVAQAGGCVIFKNQAALCDFNHHSTHRLAIMHLQCCFERVEVEGFNPSAYGAGLFLHFIAQNHAICRQLKLLKWYGSGEEGTADFAGLAGGTTQEQGPSKLPVSAARSARSIITYIALTKSCILLIIQSRVSTAIANVHCGFIWD